MKIDITIRDERQDQRIWDVIADLVKSIKSMSNNLNILHDLAVVTDAKLSTTIQQGVVIMSTIAETKADVEQVYAAVQQLITLDQALKQQVTDLLNGKLDPDSQAQVDALFQESETAKANVIAQINADQTTATPPVQPVDPNAPTT